MTDVIGNGDDIRGGWPLENNQICGAASLLYAIYMNTLFNIDDMSTN